MKIKGQDLIIWTILAVFALNVHLAATENQNGRKLSQTGFQKILSQSTDKSTEIKSIGLAITDVIREFYLKQQKPFGLFVYGAVTNHIKDVINEVTKQSQKLQMKQDGHKSTSMIKIVSDPKINVWKPSESGSSALIFMSKLEDLKKFQDENSADLISFKLKLQFFFYIEDVKSFDELNEQLDVVFTHSPHWKSRQFRLLKFFIINYENKIEIVANTKYAENREHYLLQLLNTFDKKSQKWDKKLKNFDHLKNLHGYLIGFYAHPDYLYYPEGFTVETSSKQLQNLKIDASRDQKKMKGLMSEMIKSMGKFGNFTPLFLLDPLDTHEIDELVHIYNPVNGNLNMLKNTIIAYMDVYFLVTPNDPYTNYEKLTMPFDKPTWILLLTTSGFTFLVIFVIHRTSKRVKTKVFGQGVKMPAYNTLGIFFGIGQTQIPRETFSRLILLLFIWFCLIFRTCYQSKMFEFITTDMRKPTPETLEDLLRWNYTIMISQYKTEMYLLQDSGFSNRLEPLSNQINYVNQSFFTSSYKSSIDGLLPRHAFFVSDKVHAVFNATFKKSLTIMKHEQQSFAMSQFLYDDILTGILDRITLKLLPSGIAKYLYEHGMWSVYRPYDVEIEDPRVVLTMEMLDFGFIFWLVACGVSTLAFLCEIQSLWMRRKLIEIIGLFNVIKLLRARLSDYHDGW